MGNRLSKAVIEIVDILYLSINMMGDEVRKKLLKEKLKKVRRLADYTEIEKLVNSEADRENLGLSIESGGWYLSRGIVLDIVSSLKQEEFSNT